MSATTAYVEHTAFFVRDIVTMIDFFRDVLGMGVTSWMEIPMRRARSGFRAASS